MAACFLILLAVSLIRELILAAVGVTGLVWAFDSYHGRKQNPE